MRETKRLPIDKIKSNRKQPRTDFKDDQLFELAQSIRENGLLQPIVVYENEDSYEIIAGERRYRASILAGYTEIEAIIQSVNENHLSTLALVENIQREDLNVIEEALAYQQVMADRKLTQSELAQIIGKTQSTIANKIRLLKLEEPILEALKSGQLSQRHGRALLKAKDDVREVAFERILNSQLNVRQSEQLIERLNNQKKKSLQLARITKSERLAVNTIKQAVKMVNQTGFKAQVEQQEFEESIIITVTIPRTRKG